MIRGSKCFISLCTGEVYLEQEGKKIQSKCFIQQASRARIVYKSFVKIMMNTKKQNKKVTQYSIENEETSFAMK